MINRVCLDLDGVLAAFSKAACRACDVTYPTQSVLPEKSLDEACGDLLWKRCRGHDFWTGIEVLPWAHALRDMIAEHTDQWVFLTKSSFDPGCYSGKYEWVRKHFPGDLARLWIVNGDKSMICRGPGDLLIDDASKNTEPWARAGGTIYHWAEVTDDYPSDKVAARLEDIKGILKGV